MGTDQQSSNKTNSDKRYFPRWQVKNRVVFRCGGDIYFHEGRSRDLSCAGVSLLSRVSILPPQKVKLRIFLFEEEHVEVEGHPVWTRETPEGPLTGISFVNTSAQIQEKILQYAFEIKKSDVVNHWFEGWKKS